MSLPAVRVVVQEGAAGPERLREQLAAIGAAVVAEPEARRRGHVHQLEAGAVRGLREQRIEGDGGRGQTGAQARQKVPAIHKGPTRPFWMA